MGRTASRGSSRMKKLLAIGAGIFVSALVFVPIMEAADRNDYDLLVTDPATVLFS